MATGNLKLELVDARGDGIHDNVTIDLARRDHSKRYKNSVFVKKDVQVKEIECDPMALYQATITASDYRPSGFFITLQAGRTTSRTVMMPVIAENVTGIKAPSFGKLDSEIRRVLNASNIDTSPGLSGQALYDALDSVRKACLLNIFIKASNTFLRDGSSCFEHVGGLIKLRGDRFFAQTTGAFREEVQNARIVFDEASDALHHPPDGFTRARSFKTKDRFGNLQVSFFRRGETGDDYLVDMDIDEASGIEHGFEVLRNRLADHTTSPYDIRDILIAKQQLDPGYDFEFAEEAAITRSANA